MPLDSSAKYYWDNKKDYKINLLKDIKIFLKKEKEKKRKYGCEFKSCLSIAKGVAKWEKALYDNCKKSFSFRKFGLFSGLG